jgi:PilZ domain
VVGQIGSQGEKHFYGVELLDAGVNLWGIDFPEPSESEMAVGRVLLECVRCHSQELAYLDEFEVEVLETNHSLSRHCRRCTDTSVWKKAVPREGAQLPPPPLPRPREESARRTRNDRKHVRLDLKVEVCIRHPQLGQEVTTTINVSRGGFRFRSGKGYGEGWVIEAALPYSKTGANIFTPARVVYVAEDPGAKTYVYGVMYLPKMQAEITV